jgi:hypothetical protein
MGERLLQEYEVVPIIAEKLAGRFLPGDTYTDKECSNCGANAIPVEETRKADMLPDPREVTIDYGDLSAQLALLDHIQNDVPPICNSPNDQATLRKLIILLGQIAGQRPLKPKVS